MYTFSGGTSGTWAGPRPPPRPCPWPAAPAAGAPAGGAPAGGAPAGGACCAASVAQSAAAATASRETRVVIAFILAPEPAGGRSTRFRARGVRLRESVARVGDGER